MVSVVVPAYNEEDVIEQCITSIVQNAPGEQEWEIIVVDDGSRDRTPEILATLCTRFPNLRVVTHRVNKNLGSALRSGIENARGDIIVTMDSDLTHPPELIWPMIESLTSFDVCVASRFIPGGGMRNVPSHRVLISTFANTMFRLLFGSTVWDNTGGFKAYRADVLKSITLDETGFAVQLEIMTKLLRKKARFVELPFLLMNRELGTSKLRYMRAIPKYLKRVLHLLIIRWL